MRANGPHIALSLAGGGPARTKALNSTGGLDGQGSGAAPRWVHLAPAGEFRGLDGRGPWRLTDPEAVIRATLAHQGGVELPVDYEHQSEWAERNGRPAPAAGWVKELQARPDGLWGRVEWTEKAARMIAAREYRYLSPVLVHDRSGEVLRLESAALVARPNLHQLKALNRAQGATMDEFLRQLAALLGLAETASQEEVFAAVQKIKEQAPPEGAAATANAEEGPAAASLPAAEENLLAAVSELIGAAEAEAGAAEAARSGWRKLSACPNRFICYGSRP